MSNTGPDNMLLLMDNDALRAKFFQHVHRGSSMTFPSFAAALDDLDVRKDQEEMDEIRQIYDPHSNGKINETEFLAAIHSKSKMEHMLDELPIIRTLANSLSPPSATTSHIEHFMSMSEAGINQSLEDAVITIRAILVKQQQILHSVLKRTSRKSTSRGKAGKPITKGMEGSDPDYSTELREVQRLLPSKAKDSNWMKADVQDNIAQPTCDAEDENGHTALHHAVVNKSLAAVKQLCTNGTNVNCQGNEGWTPLMLASATGQLKVVRYLLLHAEADATVTTDSGESAVMFACQSGHLDIVKFLAEQPKLDLLAARDNTRQTLLHVCAGAGHLPIVRYLVEQHGVTVDVADNTGCTPLMHACVKSHLDVAKWLANEAGANKSYRFVEGTTALMLASEMGHLDVVEWLLVESALDIDGVNGEGINALMYACDGGHLDVAKLLVHKGANPKAASKVGGVTPLICASDEGHLEVVKFLVDDCKVNVEAKESDDGMTALLGAVQHSHNETISFLVSDANANANVQTKAQQHSALHMAVESGDELLVEFLVEEGKADISLTTINGETALSLAEAAGVGKIIEFLRSIDDGKTSIEPRGIPAITLPNTPEPTATDKEEAACETSDRPASPASMENASQPSSIIKEDTNTGSSEAPIATTAIETKLQPSTDTTHQVD